jgi:hypothetical protein
MRQLSARRKEGEGRLSNEVKGVDGNHALKRSKTVVKSTEDDGSREEAKGPGGQWKADERSSNGEKEKRRTV